MSYSGQVVLVTGGAAGIGREIALQYAREGARVVVADIDEKEGFAFENECHAQGLDICFQKSDVSSPDEMTALFSYIARKYGTMDILVNNAGIGITKPLETLSVSEWDKVLNTNLRSIFVASREFLKVVRPSGGSIVNIASTRALQSEADTEAYSASKGGVISLTHALAVSLGSRKIRVNAISPGWIETRHAEKLRSQDHAQHPAGRVGEPADVAQMCLHLTYQTSGFVTGQNFVVDGGMTRKMIYEP